MTEFTEQEVFAPREMSEDEVFGPPAGGIGNVGEALPEAFIGRLRMGEAVSRIMSETAKSAKEGVGEGTPTGYSNEMLNFLIEQGVFHDPLKGKPGPLHLAAEATMMPAAQTWETLMRGLSGGLHGLGGFVGQIMDEVGVSNEPGLFFSGGGQQAKREIINFGNMALIESGMGRFARQSIVKDAQARTAGQDVANQRAMSSLDNSVVGALPTEADFANAGKVLGQSPTAEPALVVARRMPDGSVKTGKPGQVHSDLMTAAELRADGPTPPEIEASMGYADRSGHFLTRQDALEWAAKNEPERAAYSNVHPEFGLEAATYFEPRTVAEANLRRMWKEDGIHPAEAVHDAANDAFLKNEITAKQVEIKIDPETVAVLEEAGSGRPGSLSAAATEPPDIPLDVQPAAPAGRLTAAATAAADSLFDIGRDIQMKLAPMARGSVDAMATVKDYMNSMRRNAWDASRIDTDTVKRFEPAQRERMANAMEEESLSRRLGEPESAREHQGLNTLTPEERAYILEQDNRQQIAWARARDLGIVEGDGIVMHYPRMVTGIPKGLGKEGEGAVSLTAIGYDLRSRTPYLKQRKHLELEDTEKAVKEKIGKQLAEQGKSKAEIDAALEKVKVVRDIRAVNIATAQLEDAVAGRTLIENIKDVGKRTGDDVVSEGFKPDPSWFTVDHPAFKTWRPKFQDVEGKIEVVKDSGGNPVFEQVPIYVRGDFEGPLRSAMWGKTNETYAAMMSLKGKTMSLIMNSPMIHNFVEFGRAFATMPWKMITTKVYRDGYRAKHDVALMHEAIDAGMVPIGKRFFNQDITSVMEAPDLTPGRSTTSSIVSFIPGIFDPAAEVAVKRAVDKAGDFWHNTLLWDRIADLQTGLYVNIKGDLVGKGYDNQTAARIAAHYANRYAGALPKEAMSEAATKIANFAMFSRSFTLGNLGVMKDMLTGLPKDVLAQIERDAGFKAGSIEAGIEAGQAAAQSAKSIARRKAIAVVAFDVALMHIGNSIWQSISNMMLGQSGWSQEGHEYLRRMRDVMDEVKAHPLQLLNPFFISKVPEKLSATEENEPNRKDRIQIGFAKDGTAIYARNPVGKIGEEFAGYFGSPIDMVKKKQGTLARPMFQILANDAGFGRKVYDPNADTAAKYASNIWAIVSHLASSQFPEGQLNAFADLVGVHPSNVFKGKNPYTGPEGDAKLNALQAFGPFAGVTFSKGAPGGPAVGEMYAAKAKYQFAVDQALPEIRRQIRRGEIENPGGAIDRMTELNIPQGLQRYYIKTTLDPSLRMSPRAVRDFYLRADEEQRTRFERARAKTQPQP